MTFALSVRAWCICDIGWEFLLADTPCPSVRSKELRKKLWFGDMWNRREAFVGTRVEWYISGTNGPRNFRLRNLLLLSVFFSRRTLAAYLLHTPSLSSCVIFINNFLSIFIILAAFV